MYLFCGFLSARYFYRFNRQEEKQTQLENIPVYTPKTLANKLNNEFKEEGQIFNEKVFVQGFISQPITPINTKDIGKDAVYIERKEWGGKEQEEERGSTEEFKRKIEKAAEEKDVCLNFNRKSKSKESSPFYLTDSIEGALKSSPTDDNLNILVQNYESTKKKDVLSYKKQEDGNKYSETRYMSPGDYIVSYGILNYSPGQQNLVLQKPKRFINSKLEMIEQMEKQKKSSFNHGLGWGILSLLLLSSKIRKRKLAY